jgi:hypothetical protein
MDDDEDWSVARKHLIFFSCFWTREHLKRDDPWRRQDDLLRGLIKVQAPLKFE